MPVPQPVRVDLMHISMQYSDTAAQQTADAEKVFGRARAGDVWWITGTEANVGAISDRFRTAAQRYGYQYFRRGGDVWLAVDAIRIDDQADTQWTEVIDGVKGRYPDRGVLRCTFTNTLLGQVTVLASHYQTTKYGAGNVLIAREIGEQCRRYGAGQALVFYGGDQNIDDRASDTFFGEPLTSAWDELKRWESTGHRNIDVIASYDKDTRVKAAYCRALDDTELRLNTDHFLVEAGFDVLPLT